MLFLPEKNIIKFIKTKIGYIRHLDYLFSSSIIISMRFSWRPPGTDSTASCDYPVYAEKVCNAIQSGECEKGILVCGTGIGMSMCANKCKGIRAAVCGDHFSAEFTRKHNNANVLCLGARVIGSGVAMLVLMPPQVSQTALV